MRNYTKGFKAFNKTDNPIVGECRGVSFEAGKEYTVDGDPILCRNGFHFCKDLVLTAQYYELNIKKTMYAEVESLGAIVYEEPNQHKACTNHLKIIRFLDDSEVSALFDVDSNSGHYNSGYSNSGDFNSGNHNSGDYNSGHRNSSHSNSGNRNSGDSNSGYSNSGDFNSGNHNSGDSNSGHSNSGHYNSGNRNSGDSNSGNRNSGDSNSGYYNSGNLNSGHSNSGHYNSGNYNSGHFNTKTPTHIDVFNKPCEREMWDSAKKPSFLYFDLQAGKTYKQCFQESYSKATKEDIELLKALPNFDADIFYEISGIRL